MDSLRQYWPRIAAATVLALWTVAVAAGDLEPPGPPGPTMKTLDEVEPRIPIHGTDLPLTISASGSYYLAEDIDMPAGGITIAASNVTLDLAGFRLRGNVPGDGIVASGQIENVVVRNGFVIGWFNDAIDLGGAGEVQVIDVHASRNFGRGIVVGDDSRVVDSTARFNSGRGILAGDRGEITRCQAFTNGAEGIVTGTHSVVTDSIAVSNGDSGISVGSDSIVNRSSASENSNAGIRSSSSASVTASRVDFNEGTGIELGSASMVTDCVARWNTHGISVGGGSIVRGNLARAQSGGAGILLSSGGGSLVTGNLVVSNNSGIQVLAAGNTIQENSASLNSTDYDIVGGNDVGPIGDAASSTSPWANILF